MNELENTVAELLATYEDCTCQTSAIESVGNTYQPGAEVGFCFRLIFSFLVFACCQTYIGLVFEMQLTDFKKLLNDEFMKFKGNKSSAQQNHPLLRQFREAVWVHFLTLIDFDFFLALLHFTKASHDYFLAVT